MLISIYSEISGQKTVSDGILFLVMKFVYTETLKFQNDNYVHVTGDKLTKFIFKRSEFFPLQPVLVMISQLICGEFHCCPVHGP